jgi:hypothetical protein
MFDEYPEFPMSLDVISDVMIDLKDVILEIERSNKMISAVYSLIETCCSRVRSSSDCSNDQNRISIVRTFLLGFDKYFYETTNDLYAFAYSLSPSGKIKVMNELFNVEENPNYDDLHNDQHGQREGENTTIKPVATEAQMTNGLFTEPEYLFDDDEDEEEEDNETITENIELSNLSSRVRTLGVRVIQGHKYLLPQFVRSDQLKDEIASFEHYFEHDPETFGLSVNPHKDSFLWRTAEDSNSYMTLRTIAERLLVCPCSEAVTERTNGLQKRITSCYKTRMKIDLLESRLILMQNLSK